MHLHLEVTLWICLSIISSPSLVLLLKYLRRRLNSQLTVTISSYHFLATWVFLEILAFSNKINRVNQIPLKRRCYLAFLVMLSIISMNFNLAYNSIGFYQMTKLLAIPYMIIWNFFVNHMRYSMKELIALFLLLFGVGLFSVSDVEANIKGSIVAVIAVLSTAHDQMYTGQLQKEYFCNGPELQLAVIPPELSFALIWSSFSELPGPSGFYNTSFSLVDICLILGTCIFAIGVNMSTFGLIGKTSSITYQVVGHAKTVLLLIFGYIFFPSKWENTFQMIRALSGIIIALIGVFMYTKVKIDINKRNQAAKV